MNGRENKVLNDLFFLCSLIEYIGRKTFNRRSVVVNAIGKDGLKHILDYADVYHCENIDKVAAEMVERYNIRRGSYDNISAAVYHAPSYWDIGKVYHRLIASVAHASHDNLIHSLILVYNSWIADKIDNYNSSMYYENPSYLFASYQAGHVLA